MPFQGIVGEINEHYEKVQLDWKVENFFSVEKTADNRYHSPAFDCWGKSFYLQMYPNGEKRTESEEWISLYLVLREACPLIEIKYHFAIKTADGEIENSISGVGSFGRKGKGWGLPKFVEKAILLNRKNELAPSGVLTVAVTLETGIPQMDIMTFNKSVQANFENSICEEVKDVQKEKTGSEKVLQDITKAWHSGDNSDVVVRVRDTEFQAHKVILGARSPVLFAMFQHDTTENRSGEIKIDDCQPDVFREFLHYIYTGGPQELTSKNAAALYTVAEKYLTDDLKGLCLKYIRSNLSIDTFCETVMMALKYGETELLEHANDFASDNIRQIVKSVEWQRFIQEEPTTANEILIKALGW